MPMTQARSDRARQLPRRLSTVRPPAIIVVVAALFTLWAGCTPNVPTPSGTSLPPDPSHTVAVPRGFAYSTRTAIGCPASTNAADDVTVRLNDWLAAVPDGSTIEFAPSACYRLDQTLFIRARRNLTVRGNDATFKRIAPTPPEMLYPKRKSNPHFDVQGGSGLTFQDFRIEGLNTVNHGDFWELDPSGFGSGSSDKPFESGIILQGTSDIKLRNVQVDAVFGDGITVGGEHAPTCTHDVSVRSVSIDRNGRQGIAVACATGVLIDRIKILHSHATGIDLEPNGDGANTEKIEISNSYLNSRTVAISSAGTFDISDVSVHDNTVGGWDPSYPWLCVCGPSSSHRHDWSVRNNKTLRSSADISTVIFANVRNVNFTGNTSNSSEKKPAPSVKLINVTGIIQITDNTLAGAPATYSADLATAAVKACGNRLNGPQGASPC